MYQVHHVAANLAALFREHGRAVHDQLGDQVTRLVRKCAPEISVCVAQSMLQMVQRKYMSEADAASCALGVAVAAITATRSETEVFNSWLEVLDALVPTLPAAVLETDLCALALHKGGGGFGF
jgi:hypothetical protein